MPHHEEIGLFASQDMADAPGESIYIKTLNMIVKLNPIQNMFEKFIHPEEFEIRGNFWSSANLSLVMNTYDTKNKISYLEMFDGANFSLLYDLTQNNINHFSRSLVQTTDNKLWFELEG